MEYVKVAWAENVNFKDCNFRVLRGIFWGVSIKQKLLKIEKYSYGWPFFLDLSIFRVKKRKKRICTISGEPQYQSNYLIYNGSLGYLEKFFKGYAFMQIYSELLIKEMFT